MLHTCWDFSKDMPFLAYICSQIIYTLHTHVYVLFAKLIIRINKFTVMRKTYSNFAAFF